MNDKLKEKVIEYIKKQIDEHFREVLIEKLKVIDKKIDEVLEEVVKKIAAHSHEDFINRRLGGHIEQLVKHQGNTMLREEIAKASHAYVQNIPPEVFAKENLEKIADDLISRGILEAYMSKQFDYLKATVVAGGYIPSELFKNVNDLLQRTSQLERNIDEIFGLNEDE